MLTLLLGFVRMWTVKVRSFHSSTKTCSIFPEIQQLLTESRPSQDNSPSNNPHRHLDTPSLLFCCNRWRFFENIKLSGARSWSLTPTHNIDVKSEWCSSVRLHDLHIDTFSVQNVLFGCTNVSFVVDWTNTNVCYQLIYHKFRVVSPKSNENAITYG